MKSFRVAGPLKVCFMTLMVGTMTEIAQAEDVNSLDKPVTVISAQPAEEEKAEPGEVLSSQDYLVYKKFHEALAEDLSPEQLSRQIEKTPDSLLFHPVFVPSIRDRIDELDKQGVEDTKSLTSHIYLKTLRHSFFQRFLESNEAFITMGRDFKPVSLFRSTESEGICELYLFSRYASEKTNETSGPTVREARLRSHSWRIQEIVWKRKMEREGMTPEDCSYQSFEELVKGVE